MASLQARKGRLRQRYEDQLRLVAGYYYYCCFDYYFVSFYFQAQLIFSFACSIKFFVFLYNLLFLFYALTLHSSNFQLNGVLFPHSLYCIQGCVYLSIQNAALKLTLFMSKLIFTLIIKSGTQFSQLLLIQLLFNFLSNKLTIQVYSLQV